MSTCGGFSDLTCFSGARSGVLFPPAADSVQILSFSKRTKPETKTGNSLKEVAINAESSVWCDSNGLSMKQHKHDLWFLLLCYAQYITDCLPLQNDAMLLHVCSYRDRQADLESHSEDHWFNVKPSGLTLE